MKKQYIYWQCRSGLCLTHLFCIWQHLYYGTCQQTRGQLQDRPLRLSGLLSHLVNPKSGQGGPLWELDLVICSANSITNQTSACALHPLWLSTLNQDQLFFLVF